MTRRSAALVAVLAAALVAGGCGAGTTYTVAKTRACLAEQPGVSVGGPIDVVATTAPGGAVPVKLRRNSLVISFGLDEEQAQNLALAYRRFHGPNIGIADVLRPDHNAVLLWKAHPSPEQEATVTGCLK